MLYIDFQLGNPLWIVSQVFALLALISLVWSFQCKDKINVMLLIGWGSIFLAVSATFLGNYSLGVLFGLAAIRNFTFSVTDALKIAGKKVPQWLIYTFAAIFAISTITASALLWRLGVNWWVEFFICLTLLGLIIGNILPGQDLMRWSFVANRGFNIINHIYFNNAIGVVIATCAIVSNLVYYIRLLIARRRRKVFSPPPEQL